MGKWFPWGVPWNPPLCTNGSAGYLMQLSVKVATATLTLYESVFTEGSNNYNPLPCMCGLSVDDSNCHLYAMCGLSTEYSNLIPCILNLLWIVN